MAVAVRRPLLACGALAPVPLTAAWIAGGLVQDGYSARREDVSALAAETADQAWIVIAGLVLSGILTAAFAAGLWRCAAGVGLGSALVGFAGLGMVALGLLRNDCSSLTAACKARVEAGDVSWHHLAHDALSAPVLAAAVLGPAVLAWSFRRDPRWAALRAYSLATAGVLAVLFALAGLEAIPGWEGVVQRTGITLALLWLEVVALHGLRSAGHDGL